MPDREPTLDEIEKALSEATPGPWSQGMIGWSVVSEHANICALHDGQDSEFWKAQGRDSGQGPPNAHLIAHAPEWLAYLCTRVRGAEKERALAAEARVTALEDALRETRREHYYCEDCWYSCPKAMDGCCDDGQGDECNCGADAFNARIDALLRPSQKPEGAET